MPIWVRAATSLVLAGADPAPQFITTAAADRAVVVYLTGYSTVGFDVTAVTLGGLFPSSLAEDPGDFCTEGHAQAVWLNPLVGRLALDVLFAEAPEEGPLCLVAFVGANGELQIIDAESAADVISGGTADVVLDSATGDFAIAGAASFGAAPTIGGAGAANVVGGSQSNNGWNGQLFTLTAGSGTTTPTSAGDYPAVAGVIFREGAAPQLNSLFFGSM